MDWSSNLYLRWAATGGIVLLMIVIGLRWTSRGWPADDAASLLASLPAMSDGLAEEPIDVVSSSPSAAAEPAASDTAGGDLIAVDVIGAVVAPGVYRLPSAGRVDDAITAAGGLAPDANRERVNLAAPLEDGAQLRVPRVDEAMDTAAPEMAAHPADQADGGLMDINTADAGTLEELPGVGPATAEAIVAYREANGPFRAVDDLQNVKGIGPSLFAKIVDLVTVGG